ncbi:MAG TPA: hypothetical protein VIF62_14650 [Labilithrix sp.]
MSLVRRAVLLLTLAACGKDVDLGGTTEAGSTEIPADAGGTSAVCEPCASSSECAETAVCAHLSSGAAEGFCLRYCGNTTCDADDTCTPTTSSTGDGVKACVPKIAMCMPAPPPPAQADGAPLERCGDLVGPTISAECHSCEESAPTCQKNGCYGGYWCDTTTRRCQRPPTCA